MVEVGWREVTVCWFEGQRDKAQPEFRNVQDFCRGQRSHNRTLVRADDDRAFFLQGQERFADRYPSVLKAS
jgi:hypothetical protein